MVDELQIKEIIHAAKLERLVGMFILRSAEGHTCVFDVVVVNVKCMQPSFLLDSRLWRQALIVDLKTTNVDLSMRIFHFWGARRRCRNVFEIL
jgi:hypothetical protein